MPQILIVDDHPLVREAVCCTVDAVLDQSMIREAGSVNEACQTARLHPQPDLILFDLMLPDVSGLDGLASRDPPPFPGRLGSCVYRPGRCEDCSKSDGTWRGRLCAKVCA